MGALEQFNCEYGLFLKKKLKANCFWAQLLFLNIIEPQKEIAGNETGHFPHNPIQASVELEPSSSDKGVRGTSANWKKGTNL